ncbi:Uncharacterized conserved protein YbjT, contains NAD(P)-binding and DUF2867 domains [Saccharicrinis carchari]|uniref:Uncharacterized conserved protein YbjT, contains NAD(P)-binding and DUF2867 domains n=1 Tax=Saccharicrinis carchari TaxID=1168039 RepID=A0A521EV29_SACCC|nr:NmrA family NAD(P)-binding protein [Saccharicrinis carchari]SMO87786.1 Uncharacterized conserved protein YbjT, contains NAD(P)-binding and DUF2867 domains [Saccharicrinis carchari]
MKRILITGATGNIGTEVIHHLHTIDNDTEIIAAARNMKGVKKTFSNYPNLSYAWFNFEDEKSFRLAFKNIDLIFLLRPPHISQVEQYFRPLLQAAKENGITKVIFLSVQGVETSKMIPHHKVEALIKQMGFSYIFVRPSYFMQNLTTTLLPEILFNNTITLPAGKAKFNWIDVKNIGEATAILIHSFDNYKNRAYEITGTENKSFIEVTDLMSEITGTKFHFKSINPVRFYFKKKKEGLPKGFALVMTLLHFLPQLQKEPKISDDYSNLTGRKTTTLKEFIIREKDKCLKGN